MVYVCSTKRTIVVISKIRQTTFLNRNFLVDILEENFQMPLKINSFDEIEGIVPAAKCHT